MRGIEPVWAAAMGAAARARGFFKDVWVPIHVLLTVTIALELVAGQTLQALDLTRIGLGEAVAITLSIVCHTMLLLGTLTLVLGLLTRVLGGKAALLWGLALLLGNAFFADKLSFRWLGLHLDRSCRLVVHAVGTDFAVTPAKLRFARIALLVSVATATAAALTFAKTHRHPRFGLKPVPGWLPAAVIIAASIGLFGARTAWAWSTDPVELELHESVVWQIPLNWHAASLVSFPKPTFNPLPDDAQATLEMDRLRVRPARRLPNIFLFVVESLRKDAVTTENAPNLSRMAASGLPIATAVSSGNCTHLSWYSIFNSTYPVLWHALSVRRTQPGSIPIRLMKAMGYRINVISAQSLGYYDADRAIFGENHALADEFSDLRTLGGRADSKAQPEDPALMDEQVMRLLAQDATAAEQSSGQLFIVFLYSTHYNYAWGPDFTPRYAPYETSLSWLKTHIPASPTELELVRNRYRNAVAFLDSLIGDFDAHLDARGEKDRSIEIVTGDHGEEFLERGHFSHSSELNRFQTEVPLIFDIPASMAARPAAPVPIASHVDIFPTLFDVLGEWPRLEHTVQGTSLLRDAQRFGVTGRCSSFAPPQIVISDGREKALVDLNGISNLQQDMYADDLEVTDVRDRQDRSLLVGPTAKEWSPANIGSTFGKAFSRMWSTSP
jgi:glucan phosphoethanolaminetransferase (alkaline phosphatase superfamily)